MCYLNNIFCEDSIFIFCCERALSVTVILMLLVAIAVIAWPLTVFAHVQGSLRQGGACVVPGGAVWLQR
ncbi:hypothetical protein ALO91_102647 [Pseudomonas syringae pv. aceris]|uniref:Uncharacterized protein n=1 Tax=Pseudomonas syringae pv. aceris TaxID=199198 RepID=A0A0L8IVQ2_PSESX|nr:Unknown protein sequence [Pseudomonas syringae pv. aceris]KPW18100.1 hypothetical protein ALO91_102647 [Pseudomonas syringae pv. aceris]